MWDLVCGPLICKGNPQTTFPRYAAFRCPPPDAGGDTTGSGWFDRLCLCSRCALTGTARRYSEAVAFPVMSNECITRSITRCGVS